MHEVQSYYASRSKHVITDRCTTIHLTIYANNFYQDIFNNVGAWPKLRYSVFTWRVITLTTVFSTQPTTTKTSNLVGNPHYTHKLTSKLTNSCTEITVSWRLEAIKTRNPKTMFEKHQCKMYYYHDW